MKKYTLQATARDVKKQKVSKLRRAGLIPATVYGKKIKSVSLSLPSSQFFKIYEEAHETGLVDLTTDGTVRPVLIHHVQKDPVKDSILHVELHQVDLKENVKAAVPLHLVGEAPAVAQKVGVILTLVSEVEVEALPTDLPEKLELEVSRLAAVDQELKVADLKAPSGVTILTDGSLVVAKVGALVSKEAEAQAAAEAAAAAAAAAEAAPAEGEAVTEEAPQAEEAGEAKAEPQAAEVVAGKEEKSQEK